MDLEAQEVILLGDVEANLILIWDVLAERYEASQLPPCGGVEVQSDHYIESILFVIHMPIVQEGEPDG